MKSELMDIYFLKMDLWKMRLANMKEMKSLPFKHDELSLVLKSLKNNKSMDPNGMINEVFKHESI